MQEPITDPKEQLWKFLQAKKLYTKDYTEFSSQFSTPESQAKLHEFMVAKKAYTKSQEDFGTQFFKPSEKPLTYEDRQAQIVDMYNQKSQDAVNSDELIKAKSDSLMSVNQKAFTNFEKEVDAENKAAMTDKLSVLQKEVNENRLTAEEANEQLSQFGNSIDEAAKAKSTEYLQGIDNEAKEFFKNDKEILARQAELNANNYREMQESLVSLASIQNQKDAARNEAVKEGEKDFLNKLPGGYSNVLMGTLAKSAISKGKYGLPQMVDQIDLMQSSMALSEARAIMQATEGLDPNKKIGARRADKDGYTPTVGSDEWLNPEKYNKPSNPKLSGGGGKSFSTETVGQARKRAQESLKTWTPKMGKYIDSIKVLEDKIAKQNINTDLLEVDSLDSFLTTATSIIGEQAVIMPLAMLGGSMAMETAEAYYSQVSSLAEANGITIQEVIEQGLDNTDVAVGAGIVSGSLDMLGTGKIINVLKKAVQGTVKKKLIEFGGTTATEFATEMAQSLTLQIANNAVSGEEISLRDALSEGLAGALMGGLLSSSVFLSKNSDKKAALKGLEERIANPNVELPVLDTTRDEQTGQEPAITAAEEVVNPNEQPIATEPTGDGVVSAENAQVGTETDPAGANDTAVAEPTNTVEQGQPIDEGGLAPQEFEVVKADRIGTDEEIDFVKTGNPYIDPDVNENGEALTGLPVSELSNPKALSDRISDLESDLSLEESDGFDTSEIKSAIAFLKSHLPSDPVKGQQPVAKPVDIEEVVKSIPTAIQKTQGQVKAAKASLSNSLTNLNETLKKQRGNLSLNPFADPEVAKAFAAVAKDLADLGYLKAKEFTQALSSLIGEAISEADGKRLLKQARIDLGIDEAVSDTANEGLKLDDTPQEGDKAKIRSAAKTLEKAFDQVEKDNIVAKVLGRAKPMFKTVSKSEAIEKAIAYIKEKGGFENILNYLLQGNTGTDYLPAKTVMRQLAIQYYGELLKGVKDNQQARENGFDTIESIITALRDEIAREGTKAGQSNAFIDPITILGSLGVEFHNYQARKENAKKVAGLKGKKKAEYEKLEAESKEVVETLNEGAKEAVDKTLKSDIVKKAVEAVVSRSKDDIKSVKESIDKRKKAARERWKAARKSGLNATIIPGLTSADIEFGVEMASLFIEEGIVNLKELGTRIRAEFNNEISQENAEKIAAMVSSEAIDKVQGNAKPFIREKVKEMNLAIQELIRSHFLDQAKAGKKIGEKLVEELGLKGADAKKLEKIIQDEFNKYLEPYKQKALEKSLAPSEKVTQRVRKTYFEKMTELINLGALTTESYREAFGKKFGLTKEIPMTEERKFQDLIDLINRLPEGKYLQTKAKMTLMGELSKYNGTDGFLAAWLDMAYTNSLSGATTFWVNFRSNAQNLLEIPLDMINPVAWVNSFTEAIKDKSLSKLMKKNPLAKAMFLSYAVAKGVKSGGYQFLATMQTGGVDNKYFESMNDPTGFRMSNFEKPNESRSWPFKALPVKIGEKTINANPLAVAGKWVRNLVATDLFFRSIAREVELMRELLDMKIADPNSKALWTDVMNDFYVRNPDKRAAAKEKADEEIAEYERSSGNKLTAVEKKVIQNESLDREMGLSEDVLMSAEDLARDYNFTLPRNGLIPKMTKAFSKTIHNSVLAKITLLPTMPFSTIIGRIGDRSLDFVPYYGFMRAYGYGGTGIYQRMKLVGSHGVLDAFNPKTFVENSSQMGEKGTRMREAQLRKAGIGLSVSMIATAVLLGTDEDDYFFISGSYASFGDYDVTSNMDKSFPKYTIKVGDFKFNYLNTPFAAPLLYIGNKNDMTRSGEYDEKGYLGRFMLAAQYTAASFKDISILSSIDDMVGQFDALREILFDTSITQKRRTQLFVGTVAKPSISFYSSAMPQNNNMIKQINKFFDPTSYSQKTIEELAAYYSGVHMFFDNKLGLVPRHDLFGEPVKTIPGSTMISADWFRDSKADDPRWRFLIDNKAIPRQKQDYIAKDTGTGLILEDVPVEKQLEYKKLTGEYFSEMLEKYMNTRYVSSDSYSNIVVGGKEVTKAQDAISRLWTSAGQEAAGEVFYKR